jgi:nitrate reductase gamma subunit
VVYRSKPADVANKKKYARAWQSPVLPPSR